MKIQMSLLILAILMLSCKERIKNESIIKEKIMNNDLIYTSEDVNKYFRTNDQLNQIELITNSLVYEKFNHQDLKLGIKENDFEIQPKIDSKYYKVKSFNLDGKITCDVIVYVTIGDNDTNIVNVQLNSYDFLRNCIDKILLDSRFNFENEYFREFKIFKNNTIVINKMSKDHLLYNEDGDIIGEKEKPEILSQEVKYIINKKGEFIKSE
nr:hypothetical protein [Flavobacterium covae]